VNITTHHIFFYLPLIHTQKKNNNYLGGVADGAVGEDASEEDEMSRTCRLNRGG